MSFGNMTEDDCIDVPLRKWIKDEGKRDAFQQINGLDKIILTKNQSTLRRVTVAYGIVELLRNARMLDNASAGDCTLDNFVVHISRNMQANGSHKQKQWNNVRGVSMLSPALSAEISEPSFLVDNVDGSLQNRLGRYLEVDITPQLPGEKDGPASDCNDCYLFGILFYELCSGTCPFPSDQNGKSRGNSLLEEEPPRKRSTVRYDKKKGKSYSTMQKKPYFPLKEIGFPSSVSMLVQHLIDGHEEYSSLDSVSSDIHRLLSDPDCYLFDFDDSAVKGGNAQLQIKKGKLYGREKEVSLITDAFCRVSSGNNEAIFVGGFSGSGKTMLVKSLIARVDISGGYVLTQKVDQMSKERPLLDILSAFNNLCLLIRDKSSPQELFVIANKLKHDFESDFSVLAGLLPNINILFPLLAKPNNKYKSMEQMLSLHNVSFTLQRFMRIVSSKLRPVMLFLDDLQWAGNTSLELIQALLLDTRGSSCFFFVGSYRDNEVRQGHAIFELMSTLDSYHVKSTDVRLCGLSRGDLNLMISESLCILPRLCKRLSDIVFEKTEGNPYFALEFLKSLVDSRLLKYSLRERRWIWDENEVRSENITDNVLYLLTAKMTSFPENIQMALKVMSCFGIKTDQSVVVYLGSTSEYSDFTDWLNQAINAGCINKVENGFKFAHDKVMEAAYSLIPEDSKSQFHHDLGMLLYNASEGQDLSDAIFQIVDQINRGVPSLIQPEMKINIAELNLRAGSRAIDFSDYKTAYSYLKNAHLLLPENHWHTHYELSLRAFFLRAKAAYSCGNLEKAHESLRTVLEKGHCIEDKLDAYYLFVTLLHASEKGEEAYAMVREVLCQLNESVPESLSPHEAVAMLSHTGKALGKMSDSDLLEIKTMDGAIHPTQRFYMLMGAVVYWHKPELLPFLACRVIQLSLEHGVCKDSIMGFVQYAAILCNQTMITDIQGAYRIGRIAMSLFKRFNSPELVARVYFCYYGFVAVHGEPLQQCTDHLRKGFEVGISAGESEIAFYNSISIVRDGLLGGENLSSILKETDYHLAVMTRFRNKLAMPYLTAYRETISIIIDKGESTSPQNGKTNRLEEATSNSVYAQRHNESIYFNRVLQSFWMGYSTRCHHYVQKGLGIHLLGRHNKLMILFYGALNSFRGIKNTNGNGSQFAKVRPLYKDAITALRAAAELSPWNFSNKVYLLEAELHSFEKNNEEAKASYAAAITSSCSSKYVHEQGLACELAGIHYKKLGESQTALHFFYQAKQCYLKWGSVMKVDSVTQQMERITSTMAK